jgi:hypothetical protein
MPSNKCRVLAALDRGRPGVSCPEPWVYVFGDGWSLMPAESLLSHVTKEDIQYTPGDVGVRGYRTREDHSIRQDYRLT